MDKEVKYKFDYMYEDNIMSTVTVYSDGSVDEKDFTDIIIFRANCKNEKDVEDLFSSMVFDKNRPDKWEIIEHLNLPCVYDPYLIIRETRGLMAASCQWVRFEGDTITWQELRARAMLPTY